MTDLNWDTRPNRPRSRLGGGLVAVLLAVIGSPWPVDRAALAPRADDRLAPWQVGGAIVRGALIALTLRVASPCWFSRPNVA